MVKMNDSGNSSGRREATSTVADTPELVAGFQLLALKGALKLESLGMRHSSGHRASKTIREYLAKQGVKAPRDLKELMVTYSEHLRKIGVLAPAPAEKYPSPDAGDLPVETQALGRAKRTAL